MFLKKEGFFFSSLVPCCQLTIMRLSTHHFCFYGLCDSVSLITGRKKKHCVLALMNGKPTNHNLFVDGFKSENFLHSLSFPNSCPHKRSGGDTSRPSLHAASARSFQRACWLVAEAVRMMKCVRRVMT